MNHDVLVLFPEFPADQGGEGVLNKTESPFSLIIYRNLELSEYLLVDQNTSFGNSVYSKRDDI